jgi:hypothetical protein
VIDLDWLGWFHPGPDAGPDPADLIAQNLRAIWPRFRAAGARYLVLARAVTSVSEVDALRAVLGGVELTVARVRASRAVIAERLGRRDDGDVLRNHLEESEAMERALDAAALEDLRIDNDRASVRAAAEALLDALGWTT